MSGTTIDFDAPPAARSVEDVVRPAIEEIRRRQTAAQLFDPEAEQHFPTCGTGGAQHRDLRREQRHVLLTVGTRVMAPRPVEPRYPSLRVYGCFGTREEAVEHAEAVRERDPSCSLLVVERGTWLLFPQDTAVLESPDEARRRLDARLDAHREWRGAQDRAFDDAVRHNQERPVKWDRTDWSEEQEEEAEAVDAVYGRARRLRVGAEVRGQSVCALSVVPDDSEAGEVLVKVHGCFDGLADAEEWVQNVGSREETEHDICLASTCEWLYPNGDRERANRDVYRIGELQKIMDAAKRNPQNVRNFKEWRRRQKAEAPTALDAPTSLEAPALDVPALDASTSL